MWEYAPPPPDIPVPGPSGNSIRAEESPNASIPDSQPIGVSRILTIPRTGRIARISVELDIRHPFSGDLIVSLIPPVGAPIVLHNRAGGGAADIVKTLQSEDTPALAALAGSDAKGNWTLKVADVDARDVGT